MVFFVTRTIASWVVWGIFADKKRWREILPVCFLGALLGALTDNLMHHYPLWEYHPHSIFVDLIDDFTVYFVTIYLFIQWLPKQRTLPKLFIYFFLWTMYASIIEYLHLYLNKMVYHQWWNHGFSYAADWLLFYIFYKYYKEFRFNKLNETNRENHR